MYAFQLIAERKIKEAMDRGEFDNLSLAGKPLPPDDLANVSPELRMVVKILRNAQIIPEELELRSNIRSLEELLRACDDGEERLSLQYKINEKQLRYNILMESRNRKIFETRYHKRIMDKLV